MPETVYYVLKSNSLEDQCSTEGYRLSKAISFRVTDLLYINYLKIFAASESKLNWVMNMVKTTMEDVGLAWNPTKCAVVHVSRGVHVSGNSGMILDETARIPSLEDGKQYKFLGVLENVMQEDKLVLECAAKEYLQRIICHLDKSFVRPQSCNRFKPVCLAGAWLSHVDATVADNGYTGDRRGKLGRLSLKTGEGTTVARMRFFTYREIRGAEVCVR